MASAQTVIDQSIEAIRAFMSVSDKRFNQIDTAIYAYRLLSSLSNFISKQKETYKDMILKELPPKAKQRLETADLRVSEGGVSTSLTLYASKFHILSAQIRVGPFYTDIDRLKAELKVSETRWNAAFEKAQVRRANSTILNVADV